MGANIPTEPSEPIAPVAPERANGDAPLPPEFYAELNGETTRATRRATAPQIDFREVRHGTLPGNKYVRILRAQDQVLKQVSPDYLVASEQLTKPRSRIGKLRRALVGRPIPTEQAIHERLTNVKALAIFSSDALSSVAYATEAILGVLILAGAAAFGYIIPIAIAIAVLLAIVGISYRQTIHAYPNGASAYLVAKANLGTLPSLTAGASLLIDYTLTVAVSVSAGVAAITSALPSLSPWRVEICVAFVGLIILGNLRGIRESGSIFAVPTYLFILSIAVLVFLGVFRSLTGGAVAVTPPPETVHAVEGVSLFLILKAFTAGCTALTGVEAISDGVPAFKPPEAKNAATTLVWMCSILGAMFIGLSFLAHRYGIVPNDKETVVSQIARTVIGHNFFYYFIQAMTALILVLAANTSFADFPRLSTWLAKDHFMPKQFLFRGDRLAFNTGITVLGVLATILLVAFGGQTDRLLPLYAVGVFTAFTLSQSGMVLHWYKERGRGWTRRFALNLVGATATFFVLFLVVLTKFQGGAWIVLVLMPLLILLFRGINRHYVRAAAELALGDDDAPSTYQQAEQVVIIPIADMNKSTVYALNYARTLSPKIVGVHVTDDAEEAAHLQEKWARWGEGVNLVILESPYRSLMAPLLSYIDMVQKKRPNAMITVLVPEYIPAHWWEQILHSQTALRMKAALLLRPNTVVTSVPYHSKR
ncbi:MAG: APC family permease [Thermomicrobiales bacterium]